MQSFVAILMGSDSDLPLVSKTMEVLDSFAIAYEAHVASAHRTPDEVCAIVTDAEQRGCAVFVCAAGLAAHLAGSVAARTVRPVIGIPCDGGPLKGVDALYSTVQMPGGIPVATVAIGSAGAKNAGFLAAQMMALSDPALYQKLKESRAAAKDEILKKDKALQEKLKA